MSETLVPRFRHANAQVPENEGRVTAGPSMCGSPGHFRQAILDLLPRVRSLADGAERDRSIPPETIASLREAGLFRAFVPRTYSGDERPLSEVLDAMTELSVACTSTGWVGSLLAIHNIAACWLEKKAQEEIFGDGPDVVMSSSVAPTGTINPAPGGFRLAGRWGFSSGVDHASWVMLGANLRTPAAQKPAEYFLCFVRASEVKLIDDWHVCGLKATGSRSLELADVFVPNHRALLLQSVYERTAPGMTVNPQPFYRLPWESVFISALPPAALGTAIAMLEGFREYTVSRINRFSGQGFQTNAGSAMRIAEAAAQVDAARLIYKRDLAALDRLALEGVPLPPGAAERISYDAPFVVDSCSRAVLRLFRGSGARAIHQSNPLQRHLRDIHAMTQHAAMDTDGAGETYGRKLFQNAALSIGAHE